MKPKEINRIKGLLIQKALSRSKRAIKSGFYLEAIVLCDSIITDRARAISAFNLDSPIDAHGVNHGLKKLQSAEVKLFDSELYEETIIWGKIRNKSVHGFSKFGDFEGSSWRQRLSEVHKVSEQGVLLAKRWLAEASKHRI